MIDSSIIAGVYCRRSFVPYGLEAKVVDSKLGPLPSVMHIYHWFENGKPILDIWFVRNINSQEQEFGEHLIFTNIERVPSGRQHNYIAVEGIPQLSKWLLSHGYSAAKEEEVIVAVIECWYVTIAAEAGQNQ